MAIFSNGSAMIVSGLALAAVAGGAALFLRGAPASDPAAPQVVVSEKQNPAGAAPTDIAEPTPSAAGASDASISMAQGAPATTLSFALGSMDDLRAAGLATLAERVGRVEGVADETKVWVARGDVARAPGVETIYHVKGPLTCGRIGCDIAVVSAAGGLLLETVGETVDVPEPDTLVINEGTPSEVVWVFDGARFVTRQ
jgi:hypothetical protein